MEKIKALRWETGTIIPDSLAQKFVHVDQVLNLCQREVQLFHQYDQLLTDYMTDFELDLSALRAFQDNLETQSASVHCGLVVNHQCLLRNKRCLIAYVYHRMEKIKALRWETGTIIPDSLAQNLCQREVQLFHQYDQLLTDYMTDFELDLSADLKPPKDLYVEVRVLRDCGERSSDLTAHSQHFLRRVVVEQLIRQGLLEQIKR
ncbi:hypothetical protein DD237_003910 [Peronospora effusa]|uniref:Uncharacterized protein n=1 Tax=Peronospora effusa TaxID=542832 RepID=A0A3R7VZN7_9STRA|nr:hypothetical protein DD237_003910 [Peronospora effusa]